MSYEHDTSLYRAVCGTMCACSVLYCCPIYSRSRGAERASDLHISSGTVYFNIHSRLDCLDYRSLSLRVSAPLCNLSHTLRSEEHIKRSLPPLKTIHPSTFHWTLGCQAHIHVNPSNIKITSRIEKFEIAYNGNVPVQNVHSELDFHL